MGIAAAQTTASQVNFCWREDNEPYGGQGHRRNMLSSKFNCVGIGHVYYNGVHYWVEEFAYRPEINTTEVPANDSTQAVSVSVDKTKIKKVDVTFDQDAYSLRIGENTTPVIKETRIGVEYFWSGGRGFAPVLDTPVVSMIVRIIGTLEALLKSRHVQNLEKKPLSAVFVKAPKKKAFLQLDMLMRQPGLQI